MQKRYLLARATRKGAIALGLKPFAKNPSPAVTAIYALEFTLKDLGHKFQMGAGVGPALEVLQEL